MNDEVKRGPGRPRKEDPIPEHIREKRKKIMERRRGGGVGSLRKKLTVAEEHLDRNNWEYRWINDDPGRIHHMTQNDVWEMVSDPERAMKDDADEIGAAISVVGGKDENGRAVRQYLMRKPKVYYDEDQALKRQRNEERARKIERREGEGAVQNEYAPDGGIRISRG